MTLKWGSEDTKRPRVDAMDDMDDKHWQTTSDFH